MEGQEKISGGEKVYFSLGSNSGDRMGNIQKALRLMDAELGAARERLSSIIETPSWGFDGAPFLNCAAMYRLRAEPEEVLRICKGIERRLGRTGGPEYDDCGRRVYRDRPIDIDILYYGARHISTPSLTVPHPLIEQRDFVKIPLYEILD